MIYHAVDQNQYDRFSANLDDLGVTVAQAVRDLAPRAADFEGIVATGMSGVLVASPVAIQLRKPLVVLRKKGDDTHQFGAGRGQAFIDRHGDMRETKWLGLEHASRKKLLWLDDFIAGGGTRVNVIRAVRAQGGEVVAEYLYRDRHYGRPSEVGYGMRVPTALGSVPF